jgi:NADH dehydrogenase
VAQFLPPMGTVGQIRLERCDIRDAGEVAQVLRGCDAAVNLVGILAPSQGRNFDSIHWRGAEMAAEAARAAGVTRFVQVSAIGADADSPARYAQTKALGEKAVLAHQPGAHILRPSIVFGPEDQFFNRFAHMARWSPALPLIGGGRTRFQPVFVGDVADAIALAVEGKAAPGVYELGGPNIYTFRQILELVLETTGRRRALVPLPFPLATVMAAATGWLPGAPITRDQVKLLKRDNVVGAGVKTFADLGLTPDAPEAIIPTYLYRFRRQGGYTQLRGA